VIGLLAPRGQDGCVLNGGLAAVSNSMASLAFSCSQFFVLSAAYDRKFATRVAVERPSRAKYLPEGDGNDERYERNLLKYISQ